MSISHDHGPDWWPTNTHPRILEVGSGKKKKVKKIQVEDDDPTNLGIMVIFKGLFSVFAPRPQLARASPRSHIGRINLITLWFGSIWSKITLL